MAAATTSPPSRSSAVLRATHITGVIVTGVSATGPIPFSSRFSRVDITLVLGVQAIFKGTLAARPGDRITVRAVRYVPAANRRGSVPGAWSRFDVHAGQELVLFSTTSAEQPAFVLSEPACFLVDLARDVVPLLRQRSATGRLPEERPAIKGFRTARGGQQRISWAMA